ncbi:MAG: tRNA pseudouridine(55) synthase TruB [Bacteroidetes bacterium HGW-Bacteroidetes-4]|jgi:tRNA pseudouridine55 synthase|nr:MAG: tRNA pseudouridine(55) synthase TruB [Bacteroidetes bacterium HGW-Bacteroidetes-4]
MLYSENSSVDFKEGALILIDKPKDWTSFDVVNKIRYLIRQKFGYKKLKVGHAGTLDPLATGLLIVCTGKLTRQIDSYQAQTKEYITTIKLGATTPSFDRETPEDGTYPTAHITREEVAAAIERFVGEQDQIPPMFSAKKVNGKKAYISARNGEKLELKARQIVIYSLELMDFNMPFVTVKMSCSKGTYVRSFGRDLGLALESGAYLWELRRTRIGDFDVTKALEIGNFVNSLENRQPIID